MVSAGRFAADRAGLGGRPAGSRLHVVGAADGHGQRAASWRRRSAFDAGVPARQVDRVPSAASWASSAGQVEVAAAAGRRRRRGRGPRASGRSRIAPTRPVSLLPGPTSTKVRTPAAYMCCDLGDELDRPGELAGQQVRGPGRGRRGRAGRSCWRRPASGRRREWPRRPALRGTARGRRRRAGCGTPPRPAGGRSGVRAWPTGRRRPGRSRRRGPTAPPASGRSCWR